MRICLLLSLLFCSGSMVRAQQDQQTDDHAARDRQYLDRLLVTEESTKEAGETFDRESFLERAETLVKDKNYRSRTDGKIRVQTDDAGLEMAPTILTLQLTADFLDETFPFEDPQDEVLRVFVFRSFHKYNQLTGGDFRFSTVRPGGHYVMGFGVLAAHARSDGGAFTSTMIHERAHAWFDASLFNQGFLTPTWLSEGLASYVGQTKVSKTGSFEAGVVGAKGIALLDGKLDSGETRKISGRIQALRSALRITAADPYGRFFEDLMGRRTGEVFYDRDIDLRYSAAWALVHFMMHSGDGAHRENFMTYLRREAEGKGGVNVFFEITKLDPDTLDAQVTAWLKRVRVR
jgi:hypothetical protein